MKGQNKTNNIERNTFHIVNIMEEQKLKKEKRN